MNRVLVLTAMLAACEAPQPTLDLQLSAGPSNECPSTDCKDIEMPCQMYMSVRILSPDDPAAPFHSECLPIPMTFGTLCPIGGVELQPHTLPYRDLEVQVAVYPANVVEFDPVSMTFQCPTGTYDSVDGFPIPDDITPALGGRAYYRPGDEVVRVTLGCSDLDALRYDQCDGVASVTVNATVDDFDTHLSVGILEAQRLSVSVGQPKPQGTGYALNNVDLTELADTTAAAPAWSGTVNQLFTSHACLTVLDDTPQSTTSVTCRGVQILDSSIELNGAYAGVLLDKSTLDQILDALSLSQFPLEGLTVGVVIDGGTPVGGQVVTAPGATIEYLSSDRSTVTGTSTAGGPSGGVFVSRDAPFNTQFSTTRATPLPSITVHKIGGRIAGKVTVVVLDLSNPGTQQ
jgi:hypothetical protein